LRILRLTEAAQYAHIPPSTHTMEAPMLAPAAYNAATARDILTTPNLPLVAHQAAWEWAKAQRGQPVIWHRLHPCHLRAAHSVQPAPVRPAHVAAHDTAAKAGAVARIRDWLGNPSHGGDAA
jgi:hypothetical protein